MTTFTLPSKRHRITTSTITQPNPVGHASAVAHAPLSHPTHVVTHVVTPHPTPASVPAIRITSHLFKQVLDYVQGRDIFVCEQVCSTWKNMANLCIQQHAPQRFERTLNHHIDVDQSLANATANDIHNSWLPTWIREQGGDAVITGSIGLKSIVDTSGTGQETNWNPGDVDIYCSWKSRDSTIALIQQFRERFTKAYTNLVAATVDTLMPLVITVERVATHRTRYQTDERHLIMEVYNATLGPAIQRRKHLTIQLIFVRTNFQIPLTLAGQPVTIQCLADYINYYFDYPHVKCAYDGINFRMFPEMQQTFRRGFGFAEPSVSAFACQSERRRQPVYLAQNALRRLIKYAKRGLPVLVQPRIDGMLNGQSAHVNRSEPSKWPTFVAYAQLAVGVSRWSQVQNRAAIAFQSGLLMNPSHPSLVLTEDIALMLLHYGHYNSHILSDIRNQPWVHADAVGHECKVPSQRSIEVEEMQKMRAEMEDFEVQQTNAALAEYEQHELERNEEARREVTTEETVDAELDADVEASALHLFLEQEAEMDDVVVDHKYEHKGLSVLSTLIQPPPPPPLRPPMTLPVPMDEHVGTPGERYRKKIININDRWHKQLKKHAERTAHARSKLSTPNSTDLCKVILNWDGGSPDKGSHDTEDNGERSIASVSSAVPKIIHTCSQHCRHDERYAGQITNEVPYPSPTYRLATWIPSDNPHRRCFVPNDLGLSDMRAQYQVNL